jgi:serine/threonine-protein kinase
MVTEALVGETLGERLRTQGRLGAEEALTIVREAARGLAAIHREGFVHRDVKPDNLFLCDADRHGVALKVIDFGFCTKLDRSSHESRKILGTLEYIAPEQAVADPIDGRADVYALGVVLFRATTGELPFDAPALGMITHHLRSTVPPPSWLVDELPAAVDRVVLTATRKHPDNRYATMCDLLADLDAALEGRGVGGAPLRVEPDGYLPATDDGREAFETLSGM